MKVGKTTEGEDFSTFFDGLSNERTNGVRTTNEPLEYCRRSSAVVGGRGRANVTFFEKNRPPYVPCVIVCVQRGEENNVCWTLSH